MQRKNYILKAYPLQKKGFAMITAIIVVLIISTIMALSLSLTAQTSKRTIDLYLYEQVALHAKSAAELALLDIAQGGPCTTIAPYILDNFYDVNVSLRYVYKGFSCGGTNNFFTTLATDEQNGSVLMDVTVSVRADQNISTEPIRYFRRTIQKL